LAQIELEVYARVRVRVILKLLGPEDIFDASSIINTGLGYISQTS